MKNTIFSIAVLLNTFVMYYQQVVWPGSANDSDSFSEQNIKDNATNLQGSNLNGYYNRLNANFGLLQDGGFDTQTSVSNTTTPWEGYNSQIIASDNITSSSCGNVNNGEGLMFQDFMVEENASYYVSFDYRWVSGTGNYNMTVRIKDADTNNNLNIIGGTSSNGYTLNTSPDIWHSADFSFRNLNASGINEARINFFKGSGNRPLRIDNVRVYKVINSTSGGSWDVASRWQGGSIPTATDNVLLRHNVGIGDNRQVTNLFISSTGNLQIFKPGNLTVSENFINHRDAANAIVFGDSDQFPSFIVGDEAIGDIRYRRYVNDSPENDLIAPPVIMDSFSDFYTTNSSYFVEDPNSDLVLFGPFNNSAIVNDYENYNFNSSTALISGKGYRMGTNGLSTNIGLLFDGPMETKNIDISITNPSGGSPWNLIGNPYSSYLNFKLFYDELVDVANGNADNKLDPLFSGVYGYDTDNTNGSQWTIWDLNNPNYNTDLIAPAQGFFVKARSGAGTVTDDTQVAFRPAMRSIGSTDDFILGRPANEGANVAKINLSNGSDLYSTQIYFREINTLGLDIGYDSGAYNQNTDGVFTHLVDNSYDVNLVNQSLPLNNLSNIIVPLVIIADQGEQLNVSLSQNLTNLPTETYVYLEDNNTNTWTLLNTDDYIFTPNHNLTGIGRFYLHFSTSILNIDDTRLDKINIYNTINTKTVTIIGQLVDNARVEIYDVNGRMVLKNKLENKNALNTIDVSHIASGVYLINVVNDDKQKIKKIIL